MIRFVLAAAILVQQVSAFGDAVCEICGDGDKPKNGGKFIYNPDSYNWVECNEFYKAGQLGLICEESCEAAVLLATPCCTDGTPPPFPEGIDLTPLWPAFPTCIACTKPLEVINPDNIVSVPILGANMTCESLRVGAELGFIDDADCPSVAPVATSTCCVASEPPTKPPSAAPSAAPSPSPSASPSKSPSASPSAAPSPAPSTSPSKAPSPPPSQEPSASPSGGPTGNPTVSPSWEPSDFPSGVPSASPSGGPSSEPSGGPTGEPSDVPSEGPSDGPPSGNPSGIPSGNPSGIPSGNPSGIPSGGPSAEPSYSASRERGADTGGGVPSAEPSSEPSGGPSGVPSGGPSGVPSDIPSGGPSGEPSSYPSGVPSGGPSGEPSGGDPSGNPSGVPSGGPSGEPSGGDPSGNPSGVPSGGPSGEPSGGDPSGNPSSYPSGVPSGEPSGGDPSGNPSGIPSSIPSANPSTQISPRIQTPGPVGAIDQDFSDFCYEVVQGQCVLCRPFQSPDYCPVDESFALLVQARKSAYVDADFDLEDYWFPYLDDKVGAYIFTTSQTALTPHIYCCLTDATDLQDCIDSSVPSAAKGYVIKATHFHTSQGVYVLKKDPSNPNPYEVLRGEHLALSSIIADLSALGETKIIVEELIGNGHLDAEYKLHAFPGEVVAIDIIDRRTTGCECIAVVDPAWNRLDQFGCFVPTGVENTNSDGSCNAIDFSSGATNPGPVKNNLNLCGKDIPQPTDCIIQDMITIAEALSQEIGVYMRIDVFVSGGKVYVQEYAPNPINGNRHCVARENGDCIDSCILGRKWKNAGLPYGGTSTTVPLFLEGYTAKSAADQCSIISAVNSAATPNSFVSSCSE